MTGEKMVEIEVPQYAVMVQQIGDKYVLGLRIWASGSQHEFMLGFLDDGENIAGAIHKQILKATREGRRVRSGLVVVEGGVNDAILRSPQGGSLNGSLRKS